MAKKAQTKVQINTRKKTIPSKNPSKPPVVEEEIFETKEEEKSRVCYFNVCLKMLRRNCDFKKNNCNGCKYYDKYKTNDFESFKTAVEQMFATTLKYAEWQERARMLELEKATISHTENENDKLGRLVVSEIEEYAQTAKTEIEKLAKYAKKKQLFCVEYDSVKKICTAAEKAYCKLLGKYFSVVMEIFKAATDDSKRGFELVNNSFLSAHSGV